MMSPDKTVNPPNLDAGNLAAAVHAREWNDGRAITDQPESRPRYDSYAASRAAPKCQSRSCRLERPLLASVGRRSRRELLSPRTPVRCVAHPGYVKAASP